jgi:high-affinity iron transporter
MNAHLFQAFFVVWRESVEALLVVGILHGWLRTIPQSRFYYAFLCAGIVAGCVLAGILAAAVYGADTLLFPQASEWLNLAMTAVAAVLIVRMVIWMHGKAPVLRQELERSLARGVANRSGWAIASLAMIAVAREGSETVVFLFGIGSAAQGQDLYRFLLSALLGAVAADGTYVALLIAGRRISQRLFFKTTEILLLLLGASLALAAANGAAAIDLLPSPWLDVLFRPAWNMSAILADDALGGLPFALLGYRAQPTFLELGVFAGYWLIVLSLMRRDRVPSRTVSA